MRTHDPSSPPLTAEEPSPPSPFADVMGLAEPDHYAEAVARIADLDASLAAARLGYLRSLVELASLGIALDGISDRLAGRPPRRGMTTWRIRELTARKLYAAAAHDAEDGTDKWTRRLQDEAVRPRRRRRQENPGEH